MKGNEFENSIRQELKGYHFEIQFYPSGGIIDCTGCEECGTNDKAFASYAWRIREGETLESAIASVKQKLNIVGNVHG